MIDLPTPLADLENLRRARGTPADYYAPLLTSEHELVRIAAWCALLDREAVTPSQYESVVELSRYGAVQSRAFAFFEGNWDHDLAARAAAIQAPSEAEADALARRAELACDPKMVAEAQRLRFLATGRFDALLTLVEKTEQAGGWRAALPIAVDMLVVTPHEPVAADALLQLLHGAREIDMMRSVLALFRQVSLHPYLLTLHEAVVRLADGAAADCRKLLQALDAARPPRPEILARVRPFALRLNAEALEKQGDFKAAFSAYVELKRSQQANALSDRYYQVARAAAALDIPPLPADPVANDFVMTGFPRSGTTLLENALNAHPRIETFEEIPTLSSMHVFLDRMLPGSSPAEAIAICLKARGRYYDEEQRRHRKAGADIFVDKMPMRSAEAKLMFKMFPDKRYIFSIRHPYDVVLSCFKQQFIPNIAMQQFDTFEGAVKLYDFAMTEWFAVHSLDDARVHYLHYDRLVTDFEASMRGALDFVGAGWDPAVLGFAELAGARYARTPSYQKVRQGLSIGVQSSWQKYGFLFQSPAARPLQKWVAFFGYTTEA